MRRRAVALLAAAGLAVAGCTTVQTAHNEAVANVKNAAGHMVGTATLTQLDGSVRIVLEVRGLPPGPKAVHVHEVGKCEGPGFTSAGGHFNPGKKEHGLLNPEGPHAGDLPNITIAADGTGRLESTTDRISVGTGERSVLDADGSALVIHASADDFKTDPTGNSGARIACGVIARRTTETTGAGPARPTY